MYSIAAFTFLLMSSVQESVSLKDTAELKRLQCFTTGECKESVGLGATFTPTQDTCINYCRDQVRNCKWVTFIPGPDTNYCELFANCNYLSNEYCEVCISGEIDCAICWVTGQCVGTPMQETQASSGTECKHQCQSWDGDTSCNWITFDASSGSCTLFNECPTLDETCTTCTTAEQDCPRQDESTPAPPVTTTTPGPSTASPNPDGTYIHSLSISIICTF